MHDRCLKGKGNSIQLARVEVQDIPEFPVHFTMQKICYTYVKPRMYNKVILVVYIPYVILMFTCGV